MVELDVEALRRERRPRPRLGQRRDAQNLVGILLRAARWLFRAAFRWM